MCAHLRTYPARFYYNNSVLERDHTKVERIIISHLQLRMIQPWPDQLDQFQHLCYSTYACFDQWSENINPLNIDDAIWHHLTLAARYQLVQSVLKIGFALAKKVG